MTRRQQVLAELEQTWWNQWINQVLPHLVTWRLIRMRMIEFGLLKLDLGNGILARPAYHMWPSRWRRLFLGFNVEEQMDEAEVGGGDENSGLEVNR